jgi:hypothetical protein
LLSIFIVMDVPERGSPDTTMIGAPYRVLSQRSPKMLIANPLPDGIDG